VGFRDSSGNIHSYPSSSEQLISTRHIRLIFAIHVSMFDPDAHTPPVNRSLIYLGACVIAGIRLARANQVSVRVVPTIHAIEESVELAHEIFNRVFRRVPQVMNRKHGVH
jgi:hypothetical protein